MYSCTYKCGMAWVTHTHTRTISIAVGSTWLRPMIQSQHAAEMLGTFQFQWHIRTQKKCATLRRMGYISSFGLRCKATTDMSPWSFRAFSKLWHFGESAWASMVDVQIVSDSTVFLCHKRAQLETVPQSWESWGPIPLDGFHMFSWQFLGFMTGMMGVPWCTTVDLGNPQFSSTSVSPVHLNWDSFPAGKINKMGRDPLPPFITGG